VVFGEPGINREVRGGNTMTHIVLLSGGTGIRLWPLSNSSLPKQFLKILPGIRDSESISMLQRVWHQLDRAGLVANTVIATSEDQVSHIRNQIGDHVPIVAEPERRDTFPAIALAASWLKSERKAREEDAIVVLPVDPWVDDSFFAAVKQLDNVLLGSSANLAVMGTQPTYPSEKYGYIVLESPDGASASATSQALVRKVTGFTEKPNAVAAERLIQQGALWNCGIFCFRVSYIQSIVEQELGLVFEYPELLTSFNRLPKISFDYAVVEKEKEILCLRYLGVWKDIGTWNTLTEEMGVRTLGNVKLSASSRSTHVINETSIPVAVMDIHDAVVVVTENGVLVCSKAESGRLKEFIEDTGKQK